MSLLGLWSIVSCLWSNSILFLKKIRDLPHLPLQGHQDGKATEVLHDKGTNIDNVLI